MKGDSLQKEFEAVLKARLQAEVRFDQLSRVLYSTDASNYQIEPVGVVIPRTAEDLIGAVQIARRFDTAILPRGGGTSLAGQAVGNALVIDLSKYLNKIQSVDPESKTVCVQPGIYLEQLNRQLRKYNLMFGPDPSTARIATMGGVVGNNATGAHSILYGMAGDHVDACRLVAYDGDVIDLKADDENKLSSNNSGDTKGLLLKRLADLRESHSASIKDEFPRHWRRASGYSLNYFLDTPFNPAKLLAGSEGTLGLASELTLNLVTRPSCTGLVILQFNEIGEAMDVVPVILEQNPSAVELIDRMMIDLTRKHPGFASMLTFITGSPEAVLVVEFYGENVKEIGLKSRNMTSHLRGKKINCTMKYAHTQEEQNRVWGVRRAGLGLLMSARNDYKPIPCIEDVSVPVEKLANYVRDILEVMNRLGTKAAFYGHASAGCLHIRPLVNLKSEDGVFVMEELTEEALGLAIRYGGVLSGEHGDGLQRSHLNERLFGPKLYHAMQELKEAFDPDGIFNPGKVVDGSSNIKNLRYGKDYKTAEIKTYLDWSSDKGFSGAVEMCNGQGVCRKIDEGIMCPSYIATRDERDTTRARANAFRAVLSGQIPTEDLSKEEMKDVFDLCVSCKACKSECPSNVDAAKMKIEFLANYNAVHRISVRDRLFAYVHETSRIASSVAPLSNFFSDNRITQWILSQLGIHPKRSLPHLASEKFTDWFKNRPVYSQNSAGKRVVYFHDTWVSYYQPEVGKAAVKLLEAAGFEVIIVPNRVCCGRPMLSKGMVEPARKRALKNVSLLSRYVRDGVPVIGTEPSCILTFRDEYRDLLPGDEDAKILAENSFLLEEFLFRMFENEKCNISWKQQRPSVLFHGHCHARSLVGNSASTYILSQAGCKVSESGAGCCGMAGGFGYETEHYEISKAIGEDRLFPAVRDAKPETVISVSGVSCEHQIEYFTGRKPKHIAQVLADQIEQ
jgi:FAD/FMN-containing dehydrogenase/Fe-S oxidoreductase